MESLWLLCLMIQFIVLIIQLKLFFKKTKTKEDTMNILYLGFFNLGVYLITQLLVG